MSEREARAHEIELSALDGANPLGFLAALGTLVTVRGADESDARLRWRRGRTWVPVIAGVSTAVPAEFSEIVARGLGGRDVPEDAESKRARAQREYDAAKKAVQDKKKEIRAKKLKGEERQAAVKNELLPLEETQNEKRKLWLQALSEAVPRPELAIGKRIDCTCEDYRQHATAFGMSADRASRDTLDYLAAFGSDACFEGNRAGAIEATPFEFIKGSGQQFFLDTAKQLIQQVSTGRVHEALFEPWSYRDEKLSMRWDPTEDRRYALSDTDPSDESSRTVWMANLLAYRALVLFPSAPGHRGLSVTAWARLSEDRAFTWPIWDCPASPDVVRSMLQHRDLTARDPGNSSLCALGISAVFRSQRIKVGTGAKYKWNFSPARPKLAC